MKTKPMGWVNEDYEMQLARTGTLTVNLDATPQGEPATTPICLLSPSTCDKVREFLEHIVKDGGVVIEEIEECKRAAELLKLLPEVE